MPKCTVHPIGTFHNPKYVVILSHMDGKYLLSRHRARDTWETQGGHIEPGETPLDAAKRELWEESGAVEYTIEPLCDYWAGEETDWATGVVYCAQISKLGGIPAGSEMAEVRLFDVLPDVFTYTYIISVLFEHEKNR